MVHADGPVGLDGIEVVFDDERAVANAGIVLVSTLARGWGSRRWSMQCVDSRARRARRTRARR